MELLCRPAGPTLAWTGRLNRRLFSRVHAAVGQAVFRHLPLQLGSGLESGKCVEAYMNRAKPYSARGLLVSGGVAANRELRRKITAEATKRQIPVAFPQIALSTDNAAMIAAAAWPKLLARDFATEDLGATPQLRLGQQ